MLPALLLTILIAPSHVRSQPENPRLVPSLFSQSISESLNRKFANPDVSFLLLDVHSGQLLASRWDHPENPIALGSLDKPFAALAYGEYHGFRYPEHTCRGSASGCWRPRGHGRLNLSSALAYSCNSYFRMLAADLKATEVSAIAIRFGIDPPADSASGTALAGFGGEWRTSPLHMARAYVELIHERQQPAVKQIFEGMSEAALYGTAAEVDRALHSARAVAKTGTAPCIHSRRGPGDGFTVALFPGDDPRILLMVRVHGVPGAVAAKTAGQMLQWIED